MDGDEAEEKESAFDKFFALLRTHGLIDEKMTANAFSMSVQRMISIGVQFSLGGACIFNVVTLFTDPPSTIPAGISSILLATVGIIDTAAFLGEYLNLESLQQCATAFEGSFTAVDSSSLGADEALQNQMHRLVEVMSDAKERQALIPVPLVRFVRRYIPSLLPLVSYKAAETARHKQRERQRLTEQTARRASHMDASFHKHKGKKGAALVVAEPTQLEVWKTQLSEAVNAWLQVQGAKWKKGFFEWFNSVGYMARQSPVKILVTLLDMFGLIDLTFFLMLHLHTLYMAIVHGHGLYWLTPSVQASILGTALTFAAATDFVRQFTRPEEYERGRLREEARNAERKKRMQLEKRLRDALKPPTQVRKLEDALLAAAEEGNTVTAALLQRLRDELTAAIERDRSAAIARRKAEDKLKKVLERSSKEKEPYRVPMAALESAIEQAQAAQVEARMVQPAEEKLLAVRRDRRRLLDALRALLMAVGEQIPLEEPSYEKLMAEPVSHLLLRAQPASRLASKHMLKLLKSVRRQVSTGDVQQNESQAREKAALAIQKRIAPRLNLDTLVLAEAIHEAREWRVRNDICDAANDLLEDAIGGASVTNFAKRIRKKSVETNERKMAAARLERARDEAEEAWGKVQLTKQNTILLQAAVEELQAACRIAHRTQVATSALLQGQFDCDEKQSLLQRRDPAKLKLEQTSMAAALVMQEPRSISQAMLDDTFEQFDDALTDADDLAIPTVAALYDLHDELAELQKTRRGAMRRVDELMAELDAADDATVGALPAQRPVPDIRRAIPSAKEAKCQAEWVASIEKRFFVDRFPWSRVVVETTACNEMLAEYTSGRMGRVGPYPEGAGVQEAMLAAVVQAMAPLKKAYDHLDAMLVAAVDAGSLPPSGPPPNREADHTRATTTYKTATFTYEEFKEAHVALELTKIPVRKVCAEITGGAKGKREVLLDTGHKLMHAILHAHKMSNPRIPASYLDDAREVVKPLYDGMKDRFGNTTQAPILFEHRDIVLLGKVPQFKQQSFKRRASAAGAEGLGLSSMH